MLVLLILLIAFLLVFFFNRLFLKKWMIAWAGLAAMSTMLLFTAIAHFSYPEGMALMLPKFIPYKITFIYFTGIIEIAAAIGLLNPGLQKLTGWLLIVFFILILPANIYAAIHHVNFATATYDGAGLNYLWFRIPDNYYLLDGFIFLR